MTLSSLGPGPTFPLWAAWSNRVGGSVRPVRLCGTSYEAHAISMSPRNPARRATPVSLPLRNQPESASGTVHRFACRNGTRRRPSGTARPPLPPLRATDTPLETITSGIEGCFKRVERCAHPCASSRDSMVYWSLELKLNMQPCRCCRFTPNHLSFFTAHRHSTANQLSANIRKLDVYVPAHGKLVIFGLKKAWFIRGPC